MGDFLDDKRREIGERIEELRPYVSEYQRLEAAVTALSTVPAAPAGARAPVKRSAGPASSPATTVGTARRGRPKGSGKRGREALEAIRAQPGMTAAQIAHQMGVQQNYLYRLLATLADDGHVTKDGRSWHPSDVPRVDA